jgi:hypothetical protein
MRASLDCARVSAPHTGGDDPPQEDRRGCHRSPLKSAQGSVMRCVGSITFTFSIALAAYIGPDGIQASAQTYDFSFSSGSDSITGSFLVTGPASVSDLQGTITDPGGVSGTILSTRQNVSGAFVNASDFTVTGEIYVGSQQVLIEVKDPSSPFSSVFDLSNGPGFNGTASVTRESTPAPVPGTGPLSYLATALAVLWFQRKTLLGHALTFAGRFSGTASARKFFPRPARAQRDQRLI